MGEKPEEILSQIYPDLTNATTFQDVKKNVDSYFSPKKNLVFENSKIQQDWESVGSFVTIMYSLEWTCEYGQL